jgi:hypothetical protein
MNPSSTQQMLTIAARLLQEQGLSQDAAAYEIILTASKVAVSMCGPRKTGDMMSLVTSDLWTTPNGSAGKT